MEKIHSPISLWLEGVPLASVSLPQLHSLRGNYTEKLENIVIWDFMAIGYRHIYIWFIAKTKNAAFWRMVQNAAHTKSARSVWFLAMAFMIKYNAHYRTEFNENKVLALIVFTITRSTDTQGAMEACKSTGEIEHIVINDDQGCRYLYGNFFNSFLFHITHKCQY